jgi:penicillin-insensitive murein endopeptidase
MTMANLPKQCQAVLDAPGPASVEAVTYYGDGMPIATAMPESASSPAPTVASGAALPASANAFAATPEIGIPLPRPRPGN